MKIKKTIITGLISSVVGISGGAGVVLNDIHQAEQAQIQAEAKIKEATEITQKNINDFKSDLEVMGIETEQAKNLSEYFNGNWLVGKRETISIQEMVNLNKVYSEVVKEAGGVNLGQIQNPKELTKKLNREISKTAKKKKK